MLTLAKSGDMVREICDRVRRKVDDNGKSIGELKVDIDKKLST